MKFIGNIYSYILVLLLNNGNAQSKEITTKMGLKKKKKNELVIIPEQYSNIVKSIGIRYQNVKALNSRGIAYYNTADYVSRHSRFSSHKN